jgi:hypothetical protein
MTSDLTITVYGDQAEKINTGDEFVATVTSIEGNKIVRLKRTHQEPKELECYSFNCEFKTKSAEEFFKHTRAHMELKT